mmetsp:Transcript_24988/g.58121  ORF Transcript_24988/g.58121 Transcript_24988/m.58121 type:complete len:239 (+) Transcript_24988:30-746(+)|eukprot:CAMPEP_0171095932 /NCGR_PEP_ID=MMETSP0766_2-20121228/43455_1 /TAXON_ID=439317 /ORGANISM="Gambierdiscus australes, Strain CAWD 149" /LENGTH=238 /DNA_ID=CAMNT_0011554809 /DNA_START=22 /DNA_END=738 /DNA_ORIENTATION=+
MQGLAQALHGPQQAQPRSIFKRREVFKLAPSLPECLRGHYELCLLYAQELQHLSTVCSEFLTLLANDVIAKQVDDAIAQLGGHPQLAQVMFDRVRQVGQGIRAARQCHRACGLEASPGKVNWPIICHEGLHFSGSLVSEEQATPAGDHVGQLVDVVLALSFWRHAEGELHERVLGAEKPAWPQALPHHLKESVALILYGDKEAVRELCACLADLLDETILLALLPFLHFGQWHYLVSL